LVTIPIFFQFPTKEEVWQVKLLDGKGVQSKGDWDQAQKGCLVAEGKAWKGLVVLGLA
jgi:hypothetical protein